jgi:hypothetical protein
VKILTLALLAVCIASPAFAFEIEYPQPIHEYSNAKPAAGVTAASHLARDANGNLPMDHASRMRWSHKGTLPRRLLGDKLVAFA